MGLNIEHINYKKYSLTFWDVGGQATKLWKHYFDHIDAVVFVIDSTDEEKLLFAREESRDSSVVHRMQLRLAPPLLIKEMMALEMYLFY